MIDNVGPGRRMEETTETTFRLLDALRATLRGLMKAAPYDYAMQPFFEKYRTDHGVFTDTQIAMAWVSEMKRDIRYSVREVYGPDHPQAH